MYAGAIIAVMADYPVEVMRAICDPRSGLPTRGNWLPSVAEVKSACVAEHERIERIRRYREMPSPARRIAGPAISTVNVLIPHGLVMYAKAVEAARQPGAYASQWRFDEKGAWVTLDWAIENGARAG